MPLLLAHCGRQETATAPREERSPVPPATPALSPAPLFPGSGPSPSVSSTPPTTPADRNAIAFPTPGQAAPRDFHVLSDEERARFARLEDEFWKASDLDRRGQILDELEESLYGDEMLAFLSKVLDLGDEALALRVVEMFSGNTSADILPVLEKALRARTEEVRINAAQAVAQVRDDRVVAFLGKVFDDAAANVRIAGLDGLDAQTDERRLKILGRALEAAFPDVQTSAIGYLEVEATPQSVEVLFKGLDSADPVVRQEAQFSLDFLLDQQFQNAAQARAWWQQNRTKFDKDLTRKE